MGFEPMRGFTPYLVSSEALSTTQPRLRISLNYTKNPLLTRVFKQTGTQDCSWVPVSMHYYMWLLLPSEAREKKVWFLFRASVGNIRVHTTFMPGHPYDLLREPFHGRLRSCPGCSLYPDYGHPCLRSRAAFLDPLQRSRVCCCYCCCFSLP